MRKIIICFSLALVFVSCNKDVNINKFKIVAHRGYWKAAEGAENSIRALTEAVNLRVDGVEFDVRMTMDDYIVLHHDDTVGDFVIAESNLSDIHSVRLPDGSLIPTFEEFIACVKNFREIELYVDVKSVNALEAVIELVKKYEIVDRTVLLTPYDMGLNAISYMRDIKVHCNHGGLSPLELKEKGFAGVAYDIGFMKEHIDWIDLAHSVGLSIGCYVIKTEAEIILCSTYGVDYVSTDSPLECKHFLYQ